MTGQALGVARPGVVVTLDTGTLKLRLTTEVRVLACVAVGGVGAGEASVVAGFALFVVSLIVVEAHITDAEVVGRIKHPVVGSIAAAAFAALNA